MFMSKSITYLILLFIHFYEFYCLFLIISPTAKLQCYLAPASSLLTDILFISVEFYHYLVIIILLIILLVFVRMMIYLWCAKLLPIAVLVSHSHLLSCTRREKETTSRWQEINRDDATHAADIWGSNPYSTIS